jgi:hypothetical protein
MTHCIDAVAPSFNSSLSTLKTELSRPQHPSKVPSDVNSDNIINVLDLFLPGKTTAKPPNQHPARLDMVETPQY